jgi:hypothetical protein
VTLQNQFDSWYNALHARDGQILSSSNQQSSHQSRSGYVERTSTSTSATSISSSRDNPENDLKQRHFSSENSLKRVSDRSTNSMTTLESPRGSSASTNDRRKNREIEERNKKVGSSSTAVTDSDGEDEVNEDIMAFYKAKEELLKRRGG